MTKSDKKALRGKKKLMLGELTSQLGNITMACKQVGISRQTHYRWLEEDKNYKQWVEEVPEITLDFAENALLTQITTGNITAIIFFLKTKGKKRGYIEKTEIQHTGDAPAIFNIVEKSVEEIRDAKPNGQPEADRDPESP